MDNIKVSLTITLPGSVMISQQEAENKPNECLNHQSIVVSDNKSAERINFYTRKCVTASQHINISKESFDYMTSKREVPYWDTPRNWSARSIKGRLESHLEKMCLHLGGISFTYEILSE